MKFLGLQMNVTQDGDVNTDHIIKCIETYKDVDYVITPECAMTGYTQNWQINASKNLDRIREACDKNNTAIFLGSLWRQAKSTYNCCIVIDNNGQGCGLRTKSLLTSYDEHLNLDTLPVEDIQLPMHPKVKAGVLICNDMWGSAMYNKNCIPTDMVLQGELHIFIHLSNGERGKGKTFDKVYFDWHTAWLQMISQHHMIHVISVDNACHMTGESYNGRTASPSGVWYLGDRYSDVPDHGQQEFIYEVDESVLLEDPWSRL